MTIFVSRFTNMKSRMNREVHVRFCGNVRVKFPCVTRLTVIYKAMKISTLKLVCLIFLNVNILNIINAQTLYPMDFYSIQKGIIDPHISDVVVKEYFDNDIIPYETTYYKFDLEGRLLAKYANSNYSTQLTNLDYTDSLNVKVLAISQDKIKNSIDSNLIIYTYNLYGNIKEKKLYSKAMTMSNPYILIENNFWFMNAIWKYKYDAYNNIIEFEGKKFANTKFNISHDGIEYFLHDNNSRIYSSKFTSEYCKNKNWPLKLCNLTEYFYSINFRSIKTTSISSVYVEQDSIDDIGNVTWRKEIMIHGYLNYFENGNMLYKIDTTNKSYPDSLIRTQKFFYDYKNRVSKVTSLDDDMNEGKRADFIYNTEIIIRKPEEIFKSHFFNRF